MGKIELNGKNMSNKKLLHSYLKTKLNLPDYYGGNLDALWDILSSYSEVLEIKLYNSDKLLENLGNYGQSVIELFKEVSTENKNIVFIQE